MGFNNLLKSLFGDKSTRDMKQIHGVLSEDGLSADGIHCGFLPFSLFQL